MVPRHGRGALLTGGKPGNRGGPGRPPSAIRKRCQDSFEERIPILEGFVDDENEKTSDRIKAHEVLGKYGGVDKIALAVEEQPEKEIDARAHRGALEATGADQGHPGFRETLGPKYEIGISFALFEVCPMVIVVVQPPG